MKIIEFPLRITTIMKILFPNKNHEHFYYFKMRPDIYENYENPRTQFDNHENHKNHKIPRENQENHENRKSPIDNNENHENHIISIENKNIKTKTNRESKKN